MKGVIGRKLGMTQVYSENGEAVPVTVVDVSPSTVLQVKTTENDGYEAIQVGYGRKKIHRATKANRSRAEKAGLDSAPVRIREFRTPDASKFQVGDKIGADFFVPGDMVKVSGTSKGHGFSGAMKRHGFRGGTRKSHGGGPSHRGVGSAGMSATPSRTPKGRKLAGQFGNRKSTVRNLMVVDVDIDENILMIRGAVPGSTNGLVTIELVGEVPRDYEPANRAAAEEEMETVVEGVETTEEPEPVAETPEESGVEEDEETPVEEEATEESVAEAPEEPGVEEDEETPVEEEATEEPVVEETEETGDEEQADQPAEEPAEEAAEEAPEQDEEPAIESTDEAEDTEKSES
jgi:large subunit ribosomal protein L3